MKPSIRTVSLIGLLVVGILCSFAFHTALTSMDVTYTATAVQPTEDTGQIAQASFNVTNLTEQLSGTPETARQPITQAIQTGSFEGNVTPELSIALDDVRTKYVVYGAQYYSWNLTTDEETTHIRVEMHPADAEAVFRDVSSPYKSASPEVQTAIDSGSVTGWSIQRGVYRRGDTYYAIAPESDTALAEKIVGGFVGFVLTPIGRGFVAVALGLLAYRYHEPMNDRPLTVRRAVSVAALAIPVAVIGTALFETGTMTRFITGPASAFVVSSGVVAGVLAQQRRWLTLGGFTVLIGGLTIVAITVALGIVGLFLGSLALFIGFVAGIVPFVYGIVFGCKQPRQPDTNPSSP